VSSRVLYVRDVLLEPVVSEKQVEELASCGDGLECARGRPVATCEPSRKILGRGRRRVPRMIETRRQRLLDGVRASPGPHSGGRAVLAHLQARDRGPQEDIELTAARSLVVGRSGRDAIRFEDEAAERRHAADCDGTPRERRLGSASRGHRTWLELNDLRDAARRRDVVQNAREAGGRRR